MEKHGKTLEDPEDDQDDDDMADQVEENFKMFYQNNNDNLMEDQEMLLNEDEDDLLKNDVMEDDMAIHYNKAVNKMSPSNLVGSTRKATQVPRHQQSVGDYPS
jgi:hypothetical protein